MGSTDSEVASAPSTLDAAEASTCFRHIKQNTMGCCASRSPGQHEWQANVPGSYKQNPVPIVNKKNEVPADFFQKCFMKGYLRTLPKKQRIWCMIHENNVTALPLSCIVLSQARASTGCRSPSKCRTDLH